MKKTFLYIAVICAAMFAGVSCEKIEQPQPQSPVDNSEIEEKEGTYSVTFECSMAEDDATRTEFHDNGIWWSKGDKINFYQRRYINETELKVGTSEQTVPETDNRDKFSCEITDFNKPYRYPVYYWALFPKESIKSSRANFTGEDVYYAQMNVPAEQNPTADSFDPKADVLVSKYITSNEKQTNFNLQFRRVVALGKMTIKNLQSENAIKSIKFDNSTPYLAGDGFYELEGTGTRNSVASGTGSTHITMNYPENLNITADSGDGMTAYFTCRAFTLAKGKKFKVIVTTYAGEVFTKEVTIPDNLSAGLKFEEGRATKFTVDMSSAFKTACKAAKISSIFFTSNSIGMKFSGTENAGITAVKYMLLERTSFEQIQDVSGYVSQKESDMSQLTNTNVEKLNNGGTANSGSYQCSTMKEYVAVAKVSTSEGSDILTVVVPSSWISISSKTSTTKGGKITIKFVGMDISSIKCLIATTDEVGSTTPKDYFDKNKSNSKEIAETSISGINEAGDTGKSYNFTALQASTSCVVMVQATNTSGEEMFMYQSNVKSSDPN